MNAAVTAIAIQQLRTDPGGAPSPPPQFPETLGDDLLIYLNSANLYTMLQEDGLSSVPVTPVTSDNDPVGLMYSLGFGGYFVRAENASRRMTLSSDVDRHSFLVADGSADFFRIPNTAKYLRKFNESGSTWCIMLWHKMGAGTNGVFSKILSQGTSSNNVALNIDHTAANKLEVYSYYGAGGGLTRFDKVSTANLNEAAGHVPIIIYGNGNGGAAGTLIIGNNAPETFAIGAVGSTADATNDLYLMSTPAPGSYNKCAWDQLIILNRIPTADEITAFKALNPERNTTSKMILRHYYDFNNTAKGWADAAKTTPITNGVAVRAWETNQTSPFGGLNRDAASASAGVSPIFNTGVINGLGAITFDGIDDALTFAEAFWAERGGKGVILMAVRNDDVVNGSHVLFGSSYITPTAENYVGNPVPGQPRTIVHFSAGNVPAINQKNVSNAFNVFLVWRDGAEAGIMNGLKQTDIVTNANLALYGAMGPEAIAGWQLHGPVAMVRTYSMCGTLAQRQALIEEINSTFNL